MTSKVVGWVLVSLCLIMAGLMFFMPPYGVGYDVIGALNLLLAFGFAYSILTDNR